VKQLAGKELDVVWDIHKLNKEKERLEKEKKRRELKEELKDIPQDLIDLLPDDLSDRVRPTIPASPGPATPVGFTPNSFYRNSTKALRSTALPELSAISKRIAALLLLHRRELSMSDIRAVPFVETDDDVLEIIGALSNSFPLEKTQRRISNASGLAVWEDVLQLR
jgi:hypothetical protein